MNERKAATILILVGALLCAAPSPPPWDIGVAVDNGIYLALRFIAQICWLPHAVLLSMAYYIHVAARLLMTSVFPAVIQAVIGYFATGSLFRSVVTIAVLFAALGLIASFVDLQIANIRKVIQ